MLGWPDFRELEDEMLSANNPRAHYGILSAEIIANSD